MYLMSPKPSVTAFYVLHVHVVTWVVGFGLAGRRLREHARNASHIGSLIADKTFNITQPLHATTTVLS